MERAGMNLSRPLLAHYLSYAFLHLVSCLVGEGKGEYAPWCHAALDEIGNLVGEHTGLSRTSSGNNKLCAVAVFHGGALAFIELR